MEHNLLFYNLVQNMKLAPRNKYSSLHEQHVTNCVTDSLSLPYGRKLCNDTETSLRAKSSGGLCEHGNECSDSIKDGEFLTVSGTVSFSRSVLHYIQNLSWKT
jgi:hypothetical protein